MHAHRVYFALPTKGWLHQDFVTRVLPAMRRTEDVELIIGDSEQRWGHPISSSRNAIVQRFLQTDCSWLLVLDDDVVPLHNPLRMVWADKDIVGSPAKIRQESQILSWAVYLKSSVVDAYIPVNLEAQDPTAELLKVDAIGAGCILIRRKVLETLNAPFRCEYDDNGVLTYGTNFAFCRKATAAGFEVWACRNSWCEHVENNVGLLDMEGYDDMEQMGHDNVPYQMPWGGWSITSGDWAFLKTVLAEHRVKTILEFGCGLSSLLLSEYAEVESFEVEDRFRAAIAAKCAHKNQLVIRLWDGIDCKPSREHYHLAFVDGPQGKATGGMGRQHSMRIAAQHAGVVVVHDAGRPDEQQWQREYLWQRFGLVRWTACHQGRCNLWVRR